jgi:hypothetical protein
MSTAEHARSAHLLAGARRIALTLLATSVLLAATGTPEAAHELLPSSEQSTVCEDCDDGAELACTSTCVSCACCAHLSATPGVVQPLPERAPPSWYRRGAGADRLDAVGYGSSPFRPPAG